MLLFGAHDHDESVYGKENQNLWRSALSAALRDLIHIPQKYYTHSISH